MSIIEGEFTPIGPDAELPEGTEAPAGTLFTKHVTMQHLKECERAVCRPLFKHEIEVLDDVMHAQHVANHRLARRGLVTKAKSLDEVVGVFVERLMASGARRAADKIMEGQS